MAVFTDPEAGELLFALRSLRQDCERRLRNAEAKGLHHLIDMNESRLDRIESLIRKINYIQRADSPALEEGSHG